MALAWKTRMYQEGDERDIVSLMNLVFPRSEFNMNDWLWKYKNNPCGFLAVVAEYNERIVGHMGLMLADVKVGDNFIMGAQACDLCVHPDFRRQGMFLAMGKTLMKRASDEEVLLSYAFPSYAEPAYCGFLKYGWFDVSRIPVLITYLNMRELVTEKYGKLRGMEPLTKQFSRFVDYFFSRKREHARTKSIEKSRVIEASCFDERIDEFWNRVSRNYGKIVVRNRRYLNWRYFHKPEKNYSVLLAEKAKQIEGYLVSSTKKTEKRKIGYIVDVLSTSREVFQNLVHASIEYLDRQSVDSIRCSMLKDPIWYKTLEESGFTSYLQFKRAHTRFIACINSRQFFQPYKTARGWYVTSGDSDLV